MKIFSCSPFEPGEATEGQVQGKLDEAMLRLREYPEIGQTFDDLPPEYRGIRVDQHVIYYRIEDDLVHISRLLHRRRNVTSELLD